MHAYMSICVYARVCMYIYIYTDVYIYTCMSISIHAYIYIYTQCLSFVIIHASFPEKAPPKNEWNLQFKPYNTRGYETPELVCSENG